MHKEFQLTNRSVLMSAYKIVIRKCSNIIAQWGKIHLMCFRVKFTFFYKRLYFPIINPYFLSTHKNSVPLILNDLIFSTYLQTKKGSMIGNNLFKQQKCLPPSFDRFSPCLVRPCQKQVEKLHFFRSLVEKYDYPTKDKSVCFVINKLLLWRKQFLH